MGVHVEQCIMIRYQIHFLRIQVNLQLTKRKKKRMSSRRRKQKNSSEHPPHNNVTSLDNLPISPVTQTQPFLSPTSYKHTHSTLREFGNVKLVELIEPTHSMMQMDKFVTMVSAQSGSIHLHDESMEVMQRYVGNDVAFVGLWGNKNCDKSFFYDRILALADVIDEQGKVSKPNFSKESEALFFYSRPFVKKELRIFIIDSTGYTGQKLTTEEKMVLDILMAICQVIVLVEESQEKSMIVQKQNSIADIGFRHFKQSLLRIYNNQMHKRVNEDDSSFEEGPDLCWPESLFMLYNNYYNLKKQRKISHMHELQISKLFKNYNFSILQAKSSGSLNNPSICSSSPEQLYLKNTSTVFRQIYSKIYSKSYLGLKFRGNTCPHILANLTHSLNTKQALYLPRNFSQISKSVHQSIYNMHALSYVVKLKQYVKQSKPYSTDYLLLAFSESYDETMEDFDMSCRQISTGRQVKEKGWKNYQQIYEKKLEDYIREKEKNILNVNTKKNLSCLYESEKRKEKTGNWKKQYKNLLQSYHQNFITEENASENEFDDNGKSYYIANQMKLCYGNINTTQVSQEKNRQSEEIRQVKILLKKREIELEQSLKNRKIEEEEYKIREKNELLELKEKQKQIDKKIDQVEQDLEEEEERYEKIIEEEEKREEQKKLIEVMLYKKEQLQKMLQTNQTLKMELVQEPQEDEINIENPKKAKELEMLKTKLVQKQEESKKYEKQILKSKAKVSCVRKAEVREVGVKRGVRRSNLR